MKRHTASMSLAALICLTLPLAAAPAPTDLVLDFDEQGYLISELIAGRLVEFEYDQFGRLKAIIGPDWSISARYDQFGHREWIRETAVGQPGATWSYEHNDFGEIVAVEFLPVGGAGGADADRYRIELDRRPTGQVGQVRVFDPAGNQRYERSFEYDIGGRLTHVDAGGPAAVRFVHAGDGTVTREMPDGSRSVFRHEPVTGLRTSVEHFERSDAATPVLSTQYAYELGTDGSVTTTTMSTDGVNRRIELRPEPLVTSMTGLNTCLSEIPGPAGSQVRFDLDGHVTELRHGDEAYRIVTVPLDPGVQLQVQIDTAQNELACVDLRTPHYRETEIDGFARHYLEDGNAYVEAPRGDGAGRPIGGDTPPEADPGADPASDRRRQIVEQIDAIDVEPFKQDLRVFDLLLDTYPDAHPVIRELKDGANQLALGVAMFEDGRELLRGGSNRDLVRHVLLGETSEEAVSQLIGHYKLGPVSEVSGLAFDWGRGRRSIANPDVAEHVADLALSGVFHLLPPVRGLAPLAHKLPDPFRKATQDEFEAVGRYRGRTDPRVAGDNVWLALRAAAEGHGDAFHRDGSHGPLARHLRVLSTDRRAINRLQDAIESGDRDRLARMVMDDRHVINVLEGAGYGRADRESMADLLRRAGNDPAEPLFCADLDTAQRQIGGITLDPGIKMTGVGSAAGPRLAAVVYEPHTNRLVFIDDGGITPSSIPAYMSAVHRCGDRPIEFSLDPAVPTEPRGPWYEAVYRPAFLAGTRAGSTLYLADALGLKMPALGVRASYDRWIDATEARAGVRADGLEMHRSGRGRVMSLVESSPDIPGYRNLAEISFDLSGQAADESMARVWLECTEVTLRRTRDGYGIDVLDVAMRVLAKRQVVGPDGRLMDVESDDPSVATWSKFATAHFDELAAAYPPLESCRQLAVAIAIVKWLRREGIDVSEPWLAGAEPGNLDGVTALSRISVARSRVTSTPFRNGNQRGVRETTRTLSLSGGVDMDIQVAWRPDPGAVETLVDRVHDAMRAGASTFEVAHEGRPLRAAAFPLDDWVTPEFPRTLTRNGATFVIGPEGVRSATDRNGNHAEYEWQGDQLVAIRHASFDGRRRTLTRSNDGSTETWCDRGGTCLRLDRDERGRPRAVWIDDTLLARAHRWDDGSGVSIDLEHAGGVGESFRFDAAGRLIGYEDGSGVRVFVYGEKGRPKYVRSPEGRTLRFDRPAVAESAVPSRPRSRIEVHEGRPGPSGGRRLRFSVPSGP